MHGIYRYDAAELKRLIEQAERLECPGTADALRRALQRRRPQLVLASAA